MWSDTFTRDLKDIFAVQDGNRAAPLPRRWRSRWSGRRRGAAASSTGTSRLTTPTLQGGYFRNLRGRENIEKAGSDTSSRR